MISKHRSEGFPLFRQLLCFKKMHVVFAWMKYFMNYSQSQSAMFANRDLCLMDTKRWIAQWWSVPYIQTKLSQPFSSYIFLKVYGICRNILKFPYRNRGYTLFCNAEKSPRLLCKFITFWRHYHRCKTLDERFSFLITDT